MTLKLRHRAVEESPPDSPDTTGIFEADAELVRQTRQNPHAFGAVFQRYHRDVFLYCFRRLGSHEAAEDAASTVFMKAFSALGRFDPNRGNAGVTFRSWLFSIAHNVVIDAWRRERNHLPLDGLDGSAVAGRIADPALSPEDLALGAEDARRVMELLSQLPERQRAVVELRLAGLSTNEVAATLGMSVPATKSMQFRGYSALRDLLRVNPGDLVGEVSR